MAPDSPTKLDERAAAAERPRPDGGEATAESRGDPEEGPAKTTDSPAPGEAGASESGEASSSPSPSPEDPASSSTGAPPLPREAPGSQAATDDGWDFHWDASHQAYFFHNRFTGATTWENPRTGTSVPSAAPPLPTSSRPAAGGYNPAIHGDYDPEAWYAKGTSEEDAIASSAHLPTEPEATTASFNRFTGQFQRPGDDPDRHSDAAKSHRQMNAFFDVDAAANAHDGRSLKAERSGKKISKSELKQFKEKRKARKEEKRRAWLRD